MTEVLIEPDLALAVYYAELALEVETKRIYQDPGYLAARIALAEAVTAYKLSELTSR